jgi:hypothetical protein
MKRNFSFIQDIGKTLLGGIALLGLVAFMVLAINTLSATPNSSESAYPGPSENYFPSPIPPETLCDNWFSYRRALPEDKRAWVDEEYQNCVNARKTPSPVGLSKPTPDIPKNGAYSSLEMARPSGDGVILETNFSPLNSDYRVKNQWYANFGDKFTIVFAGGQQIETADRDKLLDDLSWPGVLVVNVTDSDGKILANEGGKYWTPVNAGPIRIVDAIGSKLTVVAKNGTAFVFDVSTRQFLSTEANVPIHRVAGAGNIIESGNTPFHVEGYDFENYWTETGTSIVTVMAGSKQDNIEMGALVLVISSPDDKNTIAEETAYLTSIEGGAIRVVKVDGEILTLVSEDGLVYVFDVVSRQFLSTPNGSADPITVIPLVIDS